MIAAALEEAHGKIYGLGWCRGAAWAQADDVRLPHESHGHPPPTSIVDDESAGRRASAGG